MFIRLGSIFQRESNAIAYQSVKRELAEASFVTIRTDDWTSRVSESYMTLPSSHIDIDWKLRMVTLPLVNVELHV